MVPTYETSLTFIRSIDEHARVIEETLNDEIQSKLQLSLKINQTTSYINSIEKTIAVLSRSVSGNPLKEDADHAIEQWYQKAVDAASISAYIEEAEHLQSLRADIGAAADELRMQQAKDEQQIARVKSAKNYKTWVKNSDKLKYKKIDGSMPDKLEDYSDEALSLLIGYGSKVLWEPYKRYMFYRLYIVFKATLRSVSKRQGDIKYFDSVHKEANELAHVWKDALEKELKYQRAYLEQLENEYAAFDGKSDKKLRDLTENLKNVTIRQFPPEDINAFLEKAWRENVAWEKVTEKSGICTDSREVFVMDYLNGATSTNIDSNVYIKALATELVRRYFRLLKIQGQKVVFRFPLQMHLDTLRYKLVFDISSVAPGTRGAVNGVVQRMVSSIAANMPVGKVRFVFGDPGNTGVFSNFRDLGKNESEGSRLCSYMVDVNGIRAELEKLSTDISYTINNILKGTRTTLFQHNKERSFNSSPYVFLFLMDYPQNMTAQSLQALKNIVDNGPKCGIFTLIFYQGGTALQLLRPEEQQLATEIAQCDYILKNDTFFDEEGVWIDRENEISTARFDVFVKYYNEAIKDSQQLTVTLDELTPAVNKRGDYKIPIGKNLGGETEYMSFFGSCQDYLMSGATRIGKTNALHVIIYNTIRYVPDAELYLVDFKQGVEFAPYAALNHPAIRALAVESVPEFGYSVLKHIEDKIKAISELFISNSVKNWKEYQERTGKSLPVTLVILDEFQHLFDSEAGKDCSRIIEVIAKEGGAFNVHIILATQSMSNVGGLTSAAKDNIFGRMVFFHSKQEYDSMLWGDTHLAMTLNGEVKGQMVFATGDKSSQRLLQWAMAKPIDTVVNELSLPAEGGRYETKLLLSTVRENPFSIFNAIIKNRYSVVNEDICEITIGNEVDVFSGELRKMLETGQPAVSERYMEKSYLYLTGKPNENILFVGNQEDSAESCFQLTLYSILAKQVSLKRKNSIVVLASELATRLTAIADAFEDYIRIVGQEDDVSEMKLDGVEYFFVFGLQNFRSLSYQPDAQLNTARVDESRTRMPGSFLPHQSAFSHAQSDGQLFQEAVESENIHVVAWHNNMPNLSTMFGGPAKVQDFLYRFRHKIGFRMQDKNDSRLFINSDGCFHLSENAALYVKANKERVIRPYKAMDSSYCEELNHALRDLADKDDANTQ